MLVLGAGLVVKPLLDELLSEREGQELIELKLAALNVDRARELVEGRPRATALELDTADEERLGDAVAGADLTVSLLPAPLHPPVARACVEARVPLVTTSYVSDEMRRLDDDARGRGVLLLNECGLDPGIDHMMAMEVIRRVEAAGGRIVSFESFAGGLPAPENNDNPFGYKFSWSPRGVLMAAGNPARFLRGGEVVDLPHPYADEPRTLAVDGVGELEIYPNRDSLHYREHYGLPHARDLYRGTLRYPGWRATWSALLHLGLLGREPVPVAGLRWSDLTQRRVTGEGSEARERVAHWLGLAEEDDVLDRFAWLGLLSDELIPPEASEAGTAAPIDLLSHLLGPRLPYRPGERDMVVLEHQFGVVSAPEEAAPPAPRKLVIKRLVAFGSAGNDSAMARTVGTPAALAARRILGGQVSLTGVQIPTHEELAEPLLRDLADRDIHVEETEKPLQPAEG